MNPLGVFPFDQRTHKNNTLGLIGTRLEVNGKSKYGCVFIFDPLHLFRECRVILRCHNISQRQPRKLFSGFCLDECAEYRIYMDDFHAGVNEKRIWNSVRGHSEFSSANEMVLGVTDLSVG